MSLNSTTDSKVTLLKTKTPSDIFKILNEKPFFKPRIAFIPLSLDYLDDMHKYSCLPEFYKFLEYEPFNTKEKTREYLLGLMQRNEEGYLGGGAQFWFVKLLSEDKVIGTAGYCGIDFRRGSAESGFGVSPDYWGHGLFHEILFFLTTYFFKGLNMHRVWCLVHEKNDAILKTLQILNYKREALLRDYYLMSSGRVSAVVYALLSYEYNSTRFLNLIRLTNDG